MCAPLAAADPDPAVPLPAPAPGPVQPPVDPVAGPGAGAGSAAGDDGAAASAAGAVCVATAVAVLGMLWLPLHAEQPRRMLVLDPARYPGAAHLVEGADVPAADMRPTVFEAVDDLPAPFRDGCITGWDDRPVVTCTYGDPDADRTIAVVGSSHAEHWVTAMGALGAEHGFRVVVYLKMGCPLTIVPGIYGSPYCSEWSQEVVEILGHTRPDWIFTTSTRPRLGGIGDETPPDVVETWAALSRTTFRSSASGTRRGCAATASCTGQPIACARAGTPSRAEYRVTRSSTRSTQPPRRPSSSRWCIRSISVTPCATDRSAESSRATC